MHKYIERVCSGNHLSATQSTALFKEMVNGKMDPMEISALLVALKVKGEQPEEIAGAARALRESAQDFPRPLYPFADTCGTGGDSSGSINVSTAVAFVAAEMGIPVAKHGNRSVSSKCGSADVLRELGVKVDASPSVARRCLDEVGMCFLLAPEYHPGLKHAMPVRQTLATRTIMNLIGPLVNPAAPTHQVMGVYDPALCEPMAKALGQLGCTEALVVHGSGMDEIAIHGTTTAAHYRSGTVTNFSMAPDQAGLKIHQLKDLKGGEAPENAELIISLLKGEGKPAHEAAVAVNAGALAWIFGRSNSLLDGSNEALEVIQSGNCKRRLDALVELSHGA